MSQSERHREKVDRIFTRDSLMELVEHAKRLELKNGKVVATDKLPAPVDEYGIPRSDIMLKGLLGQMATRTYVWTGKFDLHHMATPKADYNILPGDVGKQFRGLAPLKIRLPRLMHKAAHELFEITQPTSELVMNQAIAEVNQMKEIYKISTQDAENPDEVIREVHESLSRMREPRVEMMPPLDELASMELNELRRTAKQLTSVQEYNEKKLIHPALRRASAIRRKAA